MRKIITNASTLEEHYAALTDMADTPVGNRATYLSASQYFKVLNKYFKDCNSFTEFGICQGHSLAAILFTKPVEVNAYDIDLKWYRPGSTLFDEYAKHHNIQLNIFEADTTSCNIINETDMLHIDSKHTYDHCLTELNRHANKVNKYIIFHDANEVGIWKAINKYIVKNKTWRIIERGTDGVGYAVLAKV